ncbi:PH domain-containing protein [Clostridium sp. YIM B02551]|uniref:PH domain-containing protein n=1 Tax=Clostridium sp. YIM B02551 TaxID=2910679 RepID=UPI001EEBC592|nr:PH domain-containing protein [Clostridium sp. YIM B02551]
MNKLLLKAFNYINYSETELNDYETISIDSDINLENRKKLIKEKIKIKNSLDCDNTVLSNLLENEELLERFRGQSTAFNFWINMNAFNYRAYVPYMIRDIGQYYTFYLTNKRLVILETNQLQKIKKSLFIDLNDISKFEYKEKSYGFKFVVKFKRIEEKYDFRESYFLFGDYFKYSYRFKVSSKIARKIIPILDSTINSN